MTPDEDLASWCETILCEAGLEPGALKPVEGYTPPDGRRPETAIPARYADALADAQGILAWLAGDILPNAVRDRRVVASVSTGPSLLLLGGTGTGKTWQSYGVLRGLWALGLYGRMTLVSAPDLYARMRPRHGIDTEAEFSIFADAQLLIVDDLGAAKGSEWTEEVNYRLVNHRYECARPTIFTSNLGARDLAAALGERVSSRLNEMAARVTLKGRDRRYGGPEAA